MRLYTYSPTNRDVRPVHIRGRRHRGGELVTKVIIKTTVPEAVLYDFEEMRVDDSVARWSIDVYKNGVVTPFLECIDKALDGDNRYVNRFFWAASPEGHAYWKRVYKGKTSNHMDDEVRARLKNMAAQYIMRYGNGK